MASSPLMTTSPYVMDGYRQLVAGTFPHEVQLAFERADLSSDRQWLRDNWVTWREQMLTHALASYPIFKWTAFRAWLEEEKPREWVTLQQHFDNSASFNYAYLLLEDDADSDCKPGSPSASDAVIDSPGSGKDEEGEIDDGLGHEQARLNSS